MSINWIKITDRAREGIKIINELPFDTFSTVLNYVHRQMHTTKENGEAAAAESTSDTETALEDLERLVGVPREDFLLLIKTFSYILRRVSTFILKPTSLATELREKVQIKDANKVEAIVRLWVRQTAPLLRGLADDEYESNIVEDVAWKLNVEISSHCQQQDKTALAVIQLKTGAGEDINWEMNHEDLLKVFNQFESIQNELDTLNLENA